MKTHELKHQKPRQGKRIGRGIGSGRGKTAGRGTKGQNARSGGNLPPYFEGGQNPLIQRLPKMRGFKSRRPKAQIIHTDQLNRFKAGETIDGKALLEAGLIKDLKIPIRLLARRSLDQAVKVEVSAASAGARKLVEARKGQIQLLLPPAPKAKVTPKLTA